MERVREQVRGLREAALVAAVLISLAVHYGVLRYAPPLPLGRPPAMPDIARSTSPVRLRDVRVSPRTVKPRPPLWSSERAETFDAVVSEPAADVLQAWPPPPARPVDARYEILGESPEVGPAPTRAAWSPREEILAIERRRVSEELAARPRRVVEPVPRARAAPDFSPPAVMRPAEHAPMARPLAPTPPLPPSDPVLLARPGLTQEAGSSPSSAPMEQRPQIEDRPSSLEDVRPVEQLLDLDLSIFDPQDEPGLRYARVRLRERGEGALSPMPCDRVFVLDASESMTPSKLAFCKRGILQGLERLAPRDRAQLVVFNREPLVWAEDWQPAGTATVASARAFLETIKAEHRTDLSASLEKVAALSRAPGRIPLAILITDGRPTLGVVDSVDLIEQFSTDNKGRVSVFALGAGDRVNRFLLEFLSYRNRGDARIERDETAVMKVMQALEAGLKRPVLADLNYRLAGAGEAEAYPKTLTHLYADRPLELLLRIPRDQPAAAIRIEGRSAEGQADMVFALDWSSAASGGDAVRDDWLRHKLVEGVSRYLATGRQADLDAVHELAGRHGLPVPYGGTIPLR